MSRWFESEKWTDEKINTIMKQLKGRVIYSYSQLEIILPTGEFSDIIGCDDTVKKEWVGGRIAEMRHFWICPPDEDEAYYDLELSMTKDTPYWALMVDFKHKHGPVAYYDEYEELLEAIRRINDGLPPYEYNLVLARDIGLPEEQAYDYDPDAIPSAKTERITRFGASEFL